VSGVYTDRSASVPYITQDAYPSDYTGTVLDGEVFFESFEKTASIMSSGDISQKITYYVFDIPVFKGKDIRKLSLRERRRFLETTVKELNNPHIKIVEQYTGNFEAKFNEVTSQGGEGLIIKDLRCAYGQEWAKLKKSASVSCIVTGYRMGKNKPYIGSFAVSVYHNDKLLEVGYVSGFTCLEQDVKQYYGKVCDLYAYELTKADKLRMPTFHRFRDDINPQDCTLQKLKDDFSRTLSARSKKGKQRE
jgi:ATP-dependent DNA ligase